LRILIISYYFFDSQRVGSKRWFNFAKQLAQQNDVDVISTTQNSNCEFINNSYKIKQKYPHILDESPKNLFQSLLYKYSLFFQKVISKGSYYDRGVNIVNRLKKLVVLLHQKNNYDVIITTAAPFSWVNLIVDLKKNSLIIDVLVFSDLRDPWTWGIGYGMKQLSKQRISFENYQESNTILNSDRVFVPALKMQSFLNKKYKSKNLTHLPHGFDKNKINKSLLDSKKNESKSIQLIYAGTWYNNIDDMFDNLIESLNHLKLDFNYKIFTQSFTSSLIRHKSNKVHFKNYLLEEDMFNEIYKSDFYILISPDDYKDFLSAKLYEICYIGTPIIYVGSSGDVADFITKNQFGYHVQISNIFDFFSKIHQLKQFQPNNNILENYSFENLSKLIVNDINNNSKL